MNRGKEIKKRRRGPYKRKEIIQIEPEVQRFSSQTLTIRTISNSTSPAVVPGKDAVDDLPTEIAEEEAEHPQTGNNSTDSSTLKSDLFDAVVIELFEHAKTNTKEKCVEENVRVFSRTDLCQAEINGTLHDDINNVFDIPTFEEHFPQVSTPEDDSNCYFTYEEDLRAQNAPHNFETFNSAKGADRMSEDSDEGGPDVLHMPLYAGANVTLSTVFLLFSLFLLKHNVTHTAMSDIFEIICAILPASNIMARNFEQFKRIFMQVKCPVKLHYYCSFCLTPLLNTHQNSCTNKRCLQSFNSQDAAYFIEVPLLSQIKSFFARSNFYQQLQHRFDRKQDGTLRDIYDGRIYKEQSINGFLGSKDSISFILNTDGAPVFKSSKMSIWPIYLIINELPLSVRMKKENLILAGLWFSSRKPLMLNFLWPTTSSLQSLEQGVEVNSPERGDFILRGALLSCICDLPARALVSNHVQYNGSYSCIKCMQKGETVKVGARGHTHAFPFQYEDPKGPARTATSVKSDAMKSLENTDNGIRGASVNGVKGPSLFMTLKHFDVVRGIGIDYMHCVLLGVQKLLLSLWFTPEHAKEEFSIASKQGIVETRIGELKPNSAIKRLPRSISDSLKFWKASEFKSFLLYFGVPCLFGVLPDYLLNHYILLVQGTFLLLKDSISEQELVEAETCLQSFVEHFAGFYGSRYLTLNIHQLLHIVDEVRDLGPLFTHDCFSFEDKNRVVLNFIHGTQSIATQIVEAIFFTHQIPLLLDSEADYMKEGTCDALIKRLSSNFSFPKTTGVICTRIKRLGTVKVKLLEGDEMEALENFFGFALTSVHCKVYNRILLNNKHLVYGKDYQRAVRRNNSVVAFNSNETHLFMEIERFIEINTSNVCYNFAVGKTLNPLYQSTTRCHITTVDMKNRNFVAVPVSSVISSCIHINFSDNGLGYVCELPNELDNVIN